MRHTNNHLSIISTLCLFFSFGIGCQSSPSPEEKKGEETAPEIALNKEQINQLDITTTEMKEQLFHQPIQLSGLVEAPPQNLVSVTFSLPGYLKWDAFIGRHAGKKGRNHRLARGHGFYYPAARLF
jgi:hypothetical protein